LDNSTSFDLSAAEWRVSFSDEKAFVQALAVRLEQALPGCVTVVRDSGWFSKEHRVNKIEVCLDEWVYRLLFNAKQGVTTERAKAIRGITLKTERVSFAPWLDSLSESLEAYAAAHAEAREVMHRFLMS